MVQNTIIARIEGRTGRLSLNRPEALHALDMGMCEAMIDALMAWREDPAVVAVMIDHAGGRGFCAGGDVRAAAASGAGDGVAARAFFFTEYRLNALLHAFPKPVIVVMDGVCMGGGVGLAWPARYRIATERTLFAMPEAAIGLFPDVGAGWYLSRIAGASGLWLAMTGARLKAADCLLLGAATDYVDVADIEAVKAEIVADPEAVEEILARREADAGEPPIALVRDRIDHLFGKPSLAAIFAALRADGSEWATEQLRVLDSRSPQTLAVAFRQLGVAAGLDRFEDEMAMEYRIAARLASSHDFIEGVRAVLIDKDNAPHWDPPTVEGMNDARLAAIFAPLPAADEWTPLAQDSPTGSPQRAI